MIEVWTGAAFLLALAAALATFCLLSGLPPDFSIPLWAQATHWSPSAAGNLLINALAFAVVLAATFLLVAVLAAVWTALDDPRGSANTGLALTITNEMVHAATVETIPFLDRRDLQAAEQAAAPLEEFIQALANSQVNIGVLIALAADVLREAKPATPQLGMRDVIATFSRHPDQPAQRFRRQLSRVVVAMEQDNLEDAEDFPISDSPQQGLAWSEGILSNRATGTPRGKLVSRAEQAWQSWYRRIMDFVFSDESSVRCQQPCSPISA